jgi:hypothetical protein
MGLPYRDGHSGSPAASLTVGWRAIPSAAFLPFLGAVADRRPDQASGRIAGEADSQRRQQSVAARLLGYRLQRALLVGRLAATADRELERSSPDDSVDGAASGESGAGEPLERFLVDHASVPSNAARRPSSPVLNSIRRRICPGTQRPNRVPRRAGPVSLRLRDLKRQLEGGPTP